VSDVPITTSQEKVTGDLVIIFLYTFHPLQSLELGKFYGFLFVLNCYSLLDI